MILDDFMKLVRSATSVDVIPADDNGPRETKPYITARLTPGTPMPIHRGVLLGDTANRKNAAHRTSILQLQIVGGDAYGIADVLAMKLLDESVIDTAAETYNIAWNGQPRISDVPMLMDGTTYEPRAILDVDVTYTITALEEVGRIETVEAALQTTPGPTGLQEFTASIAAPVEPEPEPEPEPEEVP